MPSVDELSGRDLIILSQELERRERQRRRRLRSLVLELAKNGGFNLGNVWRNEALHVYSFREILSVCKDLEDEGCLQFRPDGIYLLKSS